MGHIIVHVCLCEECGHRWLSSSEELPSRCAKCKTSQWDGQEKRERGRPRMETVETSIGPKEIISESVADVPPIKRQVKEKREELPAGKCPHNFLVLAGGVTNCPKCKRTGK